MKPAGLKTTERRNSADHRSGLSLSVAQTNSNQLWWASVAFGLIWKKEKTLEIIRKENGSEDPAKLRISNRQLSVGSRTMLTRPRFFLLRMAPECIQGPIGRIRIRLGTEQEEGRLMRR